MKTKLKNWADEITEILGMKEEIDQDAMSVTELMNLLGIGRGAVLNRVAKALDDGQMEKVWKKDSRGVLCSAYRPKRIK